jgi:hypothetical protein
MPPSHAGFAIGFVSELVFTVLAFMFCALIFYKTRESYRLTKHQGIGYFRMAFLYLGLSYVLRFFFGLIMFSQFTLRLFIPRELIAVLFILPLGYFSTMSLFYLIYSIVWKRYPDQRILLFAHIAALVMSVASFLSRSHEILLVLQCILLLCAVGLSLLIPRHHLSRMRILYLLVAVLWLTNLVVIDRRRPFSFEIEVISQLVSIAVFIIIYYRITKWLR